MVTPTVYRAFGTINEISLTVILSSMIQKATPTGGCNFLDYFNLSSNAWILWVQSPLRYAPRFQESDSGK